MSKNVSKNISKNLSGKYSQKLLDHARQSTADALKHSSKNRFKKMAETVTYLIGNKIADAVAKLHNN